MSSIRPNPLRVFVLLLVSVAATVTAQERPNLLFILTDDQRDDSFASMGHPWVETPNIDTLLSQGIRFERAYIAEPTCRPSRASILLGNHERLNRNGFSSEHKLTRRQWEDSYPALLRKAGYDIGYVGKWHVLTDGFKFQSLFDYAEGWPSHGPFYVEVKDDEGTTRTVTTNRYYTDHALRYLRSERGDEPFCLSLCYATPHGSKVKKMHQALDRPASENEQLKEHAIYGGANGGKYREIDIDYPLKHRGEDPYRHIPRHVMDQEKGRDSVYEYDYDPAMNKEHLYRYYQMITEVDQMVGEVIAELEAQGLSENTVIVFASDHGLLMGEYGMGGKGLLYDLASQFPCVVYDPKADTVVAGTSSKELVSSLDIPVTLLDYAGVAPGPYMTGQSLRPLIRGQQPDNWRKGLFLENLYSGRDTPIQEGFVDEEWKYIRFAKATHPYKLSDIETEGEAPVFEMLFSLKDDPEERNNRAKDPELQQTLERLRRLCDEDLSNLLKLRGDYASHYQIK